METYSVINDFGNITPNLTQLYGEIIADPGITQSVNRYGSYDDNVIYEFANPLSVLEKNILDGIIASHIPVFDIETTNSVTLNPRLNEVKSGTYTKISTCYLPAIYYAKIKAVCYMEATNSSYEIRITDLDNKVVLSNKTLTNVTETVQEIGILRDLNSTQIEFSVKKNGGNANSKIFIDTITINYI
jgi:hypothetical protein